MFFQYKPVFSINFSFVAVFGRLCEPCQRSTSGHPEPRRSCSCDRPPTPCTTGMIAGCVASTHLPAALHWQRPWLRLTLLLSIVWNSAAVARVSHSALLTQVMAPGFVLWASPTAFAVAVLIRLSCMWLRRILRRGNPQRVCVRRAFVARTIRTFVSIVLW